MDGYHLCTGVYRGRFLASERGRFFGSMSLSMKELLDDCSGHISQVLNFLAYLNFSIIFSRNT